MQRRDFVKAIVVATVAAPGALAQQAEKLPAPAPKAPAPEPWMRGLLEARPLAMTPLVADAIAQSDTRFFNASQTATLRHFCDLIQPAYAGYPGAIAAGAPEFLDFLIGASPRDRREMYQSGLDRLESESQQQFQEPFATLDPAQADQIIRPQLRTWMSDHPPSEPFPRFINLAHVDIRDATVNSQIWSDAAHAAGRPTPNVDLYWYPVDPVLRRDTASTSR
jgi:hypothetical protein